MQFTGRQLDAVEVQHLGQDMCVVAGPGSGKTTVLVERFRRLVCEAGIPPLRILAITFTEKAATNMKEKLAEAFRDRPQERRQLERAYVSTVHGFCMRLLKENAIHAGIDPEFRVMDERQSAAMQALAANAALDQLFAEDPESMRGLMRGLAGVNLGAAMLEIYDAVRASGRPLETLGEYPAPVSPRFDDLLDRISALGAERLIDWSANQRAELAALVAWAGRHADLRGAPASRAHFQALEDFDCNLNRLKKSNPIYDQVRSIKSSVEDVYRRLLTEFYDRERAAIVQVLLRFERLYEERKRALAAVDYADLEAITVLLLEDNREVRERIRGQFDQVLMDEFQDTNGLQAKLLGLVRPPDRFYAVGDINQSIYGFRHADPGVFREYREAVERNGKPLADLIENWRSRPDILKAVTAILNGREGIEERALVAAQQFAPKDAPSVEVLAAAGADAEAALALEAQWVARRILELEGALPLRMGAAGFGDIAVLVRNSGVMSAFTAAFDTAGIPYLVSRGKGFHETREIADLTHLLRVLVNPHDEISMAAVLRSPLVGASDEALLRLTLSGNPGEALRRLEMNLMDAADLDKLQRFRGQLRDWRAAKDYVSFDRLLVNAIDQCGYPYAPASRAAANIEKFLAMAREAASRLTLAEFVEELELARASDPREADAPPEDSAHAVRIMTVHAAKGLEFPIVFVAALHKGVDTGLGDLSFSPRLGLGARWRNPATGEEKDDTYQHAIREERRERETEEGNRLFYVAMTRAEEHLVLSFSRGETVPKKSWAALLLERLRLDLEPADDARVVPIEAPDGSDFPVLVRSAARAPERLVREGAVRELEAPLQLAPQPVTGQHDSNATVTAVATFSRCPRRYYLEQYLGWDGGRRAGDGAAADLPAGELGREVHALLAETVAADQTPHPEAMRLAEVFRSSPLGRRAARAGRIERESGFLMAIEDVVLRGQIDLWFEEAGELVLVDYKTDAVTAAEADERAEDYGEQIRLYALALERMAGRLPDRAFVHFLRPNAAVEVNLAPLVLQASQALVRDFREAQEHLAFPLQEGEQCLRCPFLGGLCPARVGDRASGRSVLSAG